MKYTLETESIFWFYSGMSIVQPKQPRSRATMQRFIDAGLQLVEQHAWDGITVADLVRSANSSVGAFYTRFGDKATLLRVMDDHYADTLCELFKDFSDSPPDTLRSSVNALLTTLVEFHLAHRGLVRTLVMTARSATDPAYAANSERINTQLPAVIRRLAQSSDLTADVRKSHLSQALAFTYSAMREQLLFAEAVPVKLAGKRKLITALTASFIGTVNELAHT